MENEIWKDVKGFEGVYQISSFGRVKSFDRYKSNYSKKQFVPGQFMKPYLSVGYPRVDLCSGNIRYKKHIHRLLAEHFIPNPLNLPTVNHINGIKTDFRLENLEWANMQRQANHAIEIRLRKIVSKKVLQMDIDNRVIIKEWDSTRATKSYGFHPASVNKVITGKYTHHKGFYWKYLEN